MKKELGIFTLLLVLCGVTAAINPRFLSATNLTNMANIIGLFGIFSLGLGMVIITGGIDLSVGSIDVSHRDRVAVCFVGVEGE
jgi:ribose transport system permease protein